MDSNLNNLLALLVGGGLLTGLVGLATIRTGRQRAYDARIDAELTQLREEAEQWEARAREAEARERARAEEVFRLRMVLIQAGIEPPEVKR